ncbi:OmpA family protein [Moheibacter sediminis]|uniref:OmpA family protein n=1 Tax=Moheibacter sediminis TaxID=1434700 RepID=A0A1W2BR39_9FLAO|nr:OmpA family protein [Moheibacter sediminis]SMC75403.1 OmpA family protein [Moheibacter sediminis]
MKLLFPLMIMLFGIQISNAQKILEKLGDKAIDAAEKTVERRVEKESSEKTDKVLDGVFEGKKDKKSKKDKKNKNNKENSSEENNNSNSSSSKSVNRSSDFEPGNQVLVMEDFVQDAINDFPANWNTDASGKVVTISDLDGKWLELTTNGAFIMQSVRSLPENFTFEFDLYVAPSFSYYDQPLWLGMVNLNSQKEFPIWKRFWEKRGKEKRNGVLLQMHPQQEGGQKLGFSEYEIWEHGNKPFSNVLKGIKNFNLNNNNLVKVQIWRQGKRLRVYFGDEKIWDLPQAFDGNSKINSLIFSRGEAKEGNYFYLSNIRLATSGEDVRSQILKDGKYSTNAILFNSGSSKLKSESDSSIKKIADILKENPDLRLKIIGHTDADGDQNANLRLSKERAESVKNELINIYGINSSKLQTDGKGESEPVAENSTSEGKAQNRRVEFIRIN